MKECYNQPERWKERGRQAAGGSSLAHLWWLLLILLLCDPALSPLSRPPPAFCLPAWHLSATANHPPSSMTVRGARPAAAAAAASCLPLLMFVSSLQALSFSLSRWAAGRMGGWVMDVARYCRSPTSPPPLPATGWLAVRPPPATYLPTSRTPHVRILPSLSLSCSLSLLAHVLACTPYRGLTGFPALAGAASWLLLLAWLLACCSSPWPRSVCW